jgi:hypothetical protein
MVFSDLIDDKDLVGRWFTYRNQACAVRAIGVVQETKGQAGSEAGMWSLEVEGRVVSKVYGSLDAATRKLMEVAG